jgi:hypothetical protein
VSYTPTGSCRFRVPPCGPRSSCRRLCRRSSHRRVPGRPRGSAGWLALAAGWPALRGQGCWAWLRGRAGQSAWQLLSVLTWLRGGQGEEKGKKRRAETVYWARIGQEGWGGVAGLNSSSGDQVSCPLVLGGLEGEHPGTTKVVVWRLPSRAVSSSQALGTRITVGQGVTASPNPLGAKPPLSFLECPLTVPLLFSSTSRPVKTGAQDDATKEQPQPPLF